jgi:hypothetical protein
VTDVFLPQLKHQLLLLLAGSCCLVLPTCHCVGI